MWYKKVFKWYAEEIYPHLWSTQVFWLDLAYWFKIELLGSRLWLKNFSAEAKKLQHVLISL